MIKKRIIKTILFFLGAILILSYAGKVVSNKAADSRTYEIYGSFYKEEKNSLDAVYIGSSDAYAFWLAPWA